MSAPQSIKTSKSEPLSLDVHEDDITIGDKTTKRWNYFVTNVPVDSQAAKGTTTQQPLQSDLPQGFNADKYVLASLDVSELGSLNPVTRLYVEENENFKKSVKDFKEKAKEDADKKAEGKKLIFKTVADKANYTVGPCIVSPSSLNGEKKVTLLISPVKSTLWSRLKNVRKNNGNPLDKALLVIAFMLCILVILGFGVLWGISVFASDRILDTDTKKWSANFSMVALSSLFITVVRIFRDYYELFTSSLTIYTVITVFVLIALTSVDKLVIVKFFAEPNPQISTIGGFILGELFGVVLYRQLQEECEWQVFSIIGICYVVLILLLWYFGLQSFLENKKKKAVGFMRFLRRLETHPQEV